MKRLQWVQFGGVLVTACLLSIGSAAEPASEDEAYDPRDWFDANNYEYDDRLAVDAGLGRYSGASFGPDVVGSGSNAYDETWPNPAVYPDVYRQNVWDPEMKLEQGWHYDWNSRENRWEKDYGWHTGKYDYNDEQIEQRARTRLPQSNERKEPSQQRRTVQGTIQHLETFRLEDRSGKQDDHLVARIVLRDGRNVLVELGASPVASRFGLTPRDRVEIRGETGRISGRRVLVADSLTVNGRTYRVERDRQSARVASFSGRIQDITPITLTDESGTRKRFAQVALQNGEICLADLRGESIASLGLSEGERITLKGHRDQISGRAILRVDEVTVNGEKTTLRSGKKS